MLEIEGKYITTSNYNKFTKEIIDVTIKRKELVYKNDIYNLAINFDLNTKLNTWETKSDLKVEQEKCQNCKHMI